MNDAPLEIVARNVRSARAAAGLSLDALAARAEVSKGALVALEGTRGNPNLTTLVRLADALGRSVSSLMEDAREEPVVVVDADDVAPLWTGPSGGMARLLLTTPRPAPGEVWRWLLHPGERHRGGAPGRLGPGARDRSPAHRRVARGLQRLRCQAEPLPKLGRGAHQPRPEGAGATARQCAGRSLQRDQRPPRRATWR